MFIGKKIEPKFVVCLNDCSDRNADLRQWMSSIAHLGVPAKVVGFKRRIEAAGQLVDTLEESGGIPGVIILNSANREDQDEDNENGVPFGYFWEGDRLVISTIDDKGELLSLLKNYRLVEHIHMLDVPEVVAWMRQYDLIDRQIAEWIRRNQFRSLKFAFPLAKLICAGYVPPSRTVSFAHTVRDALPQVWFVDEWDNLPYGNCKTNVTLSEYRVGFRGRRLGLLGSLPFYERLSDVPKNGKGAVVPGSSGAWDDPYVEIVVRGGSAAKELHLGVGSVLE